MRNTEEVEHTEADEREPSFVEIGSGRVNSCDSSVVIIVSLAAMPDEDSFATKE